MRTLALALLAAIVASAATLTAVSADNHVPHLGTVTAGNSLTLTLPVIDPPAASTSTSSNGLVTYRWSACGAPWTVSLFTKSSLVGTEFLSGARVRVTIRADAQIGTRNTSYILHGMRSLTRVSTLTGSAVTTTTREACSTPIQQATYTVRAASRPSAVPASEAHLSSTPIRSRPVSNPSCYVVVTSHSSGRSGDVKILGGVSMTSCMTRDELYRNGFVDAVPDPTVPGAVNSAISDFVNGFKCAPGENLPPTPAAVASTTSCLQPEGWTRHE